MVEEYIITNIFELNFKEPIKKCMKIERTCGFSGYRYVILETTKSINDQTADEYRKQRFSFGF